MTSSPPLYLPRVVSVVSTTAFHFLQFRHIHFVVPTCAIAFIHARQFKDVVVNQICKRGCKETQLIPPTSLRYTLLNNEQGSPDLPTRIRSAWWVMVRITSLIHVHTLTICLQCPRQLQCIRRRWQWAGDFWSMWRIAGCSYNVLACTFDFVASNAWKQHRVSV